MCLVLSQIKANVISSLTSWHRTAPVILMTSSDLTAPCMCVCGLTSEALIRMGLLLAYCAAERSLDT